MLESAPASITMSFTEPPDADLSTVAVLDSTGAELDTPPAERGAPPRSLAVALPPGLGDGVYTVSWRVVSEADGHLTVGVFTFGVGVDPGHAAAPDVHVPEPAPQASPLAVAARCCSTPASCRHWAPPSSASSRSRAGCPDAGGCCRSRARWRSWERSRWCSPRPTPSAPRWATCCVRGRDALHLARSRPPRSRWCSGVLAGRSAARWPLVLTGLAAAARDVGARHERARGRALSPAARGAGPVRAFRRGGHLDRRRGAPRDRPVEPGGEQPRPRAGGGRGAGGVGCRDDRRGSGVAPRSRPLGVPARRRSAPRRDRRVLEDRRLGGARGGAHGRVRGPSARPAASTTSARCSPTPRTARRC